MRVAMIVFHCVISSNQDRPVFTDPEVVGDLYVRMQAVTDRGVQILGYALMSSHLHILLGVEDAGQIGRAVQCLIGPVARSLNARLQQHGGVFRRAFWRVPAGSDAYLWVLPLYIHANPAPNTVDVGRLDVGLRSSHRAYTRPEAPSWLRPGVGLGQYGGGYLGALQEFLEDRAARLRNGHALLPDAEERVLLAISHACGTRPDTVLDARRGGRRDRLMLAHVLGQVVGMTAAGRVLGVNRETATRWARIASEHPDFEALRSQLGSSKTQVM